MEVLYRNQINLATIFMMVIVFWIASKKLDKTNPLNRSFLFAGVGIILGLILESSTVFFNDDPNNVVIVLDKIFSAALFMLAPIISFCFFYFIFNLVLPGRKFKNWVWSIIALPIISNIVFASLSPFYGFFFSINSIGEYSRGPLFMLSAFSTYLFMILGVSLVLLNHKKLHSADFWLILGIGIIPIIGGVIQSLVYGILTMWSSAGFALLLGYLFLQERMIRLDSLTGAWNRESFYYTYSRRIQMNPEGKFGAIYFDIDNLKSINDTFGHLEGDNAIKIVMEIIKKILPPEATTCRLGGDEFIILHECEKEEEIDKILNDIKKAFINYNKDTTNKYTLKCSFGKTMYTSDISSLNALLSKLDMLMYQEKFSKKR